MTPYNSEMPFVKHTHPLKHCPKVFADYRKESNFLFTRLKNK
jgi:hypothetical protein